MGVAHELIIIIVAIIALIAPAQHDGAAAWATYIPTTLFGLHNNASDSSNTSRAFNMWMQEGSAHSSSPQKSFVGVQVVSYFMYSEYPNGANAYLSQQLEGIWEGGAIPLLEVFPSFDAVLSPSEFNSFLDQMSPYFNDAAVRDEGLEVSMASLVCNVILPFLYPTLSYTSDDDGWCNGASLEDVVVDGTNGNVAFPARRLYIEFAPSFTSSSFPWSSEFTGNQSVVDNTQHVVASPGRRLSTSVGDQQRWAISNSATSYQTLWETVMGKWFLTPLQDWLLQQGHQAVVSGGHEVVASVIREQFRVGRFVQSIWTSSATQLSSEWSDTVPSSWGAQLTSWLPRWSCTSVSNDSYAICGAGSSNTCGPDWLGLSSVIQNTTLDIIMPSDLVTPMLNALKVVASLIQDGDIDLCRAPELTEKMAPIAILHFGASADVPLQGGAQRKDRWIHDMLQFAFQDDDVLMAVPMNVEYYEWVLGSPIARVYMEIYSFDHGSFCCDGTDPANGAAVLTQVSAALMDAISSKQIVPLSSTPAGSCMTCRLIDDATFVGASNSTTVACACPAADANAADSPWYKRVFLNVVVLSCLGVVLVVIAVLLFWKLRRRTVRHVRRRMILGRYIVHRVIHHCRTFSSVLMAHDAKYPGSSVIVKQYVLSTDTAIAVANNEIEKSRACTGYPHLAQVIQCTFAWKQPRRRPGVNDERRVGSGSDQRGGLHARFLPDASSRALNVESHRSLNNADHPQQDARNVVMNDTNAAKIPFAILVLRHYSLGDLKMFVQHMCELSGGDRALDRHSGVMYSDAVSIMTQLCLALHTLHRVIRPDDPLIHRDIKPENIFLERRPLRGKPTEFVILAYLGDFGCSLFESQFAAIDTLGAADPPAPQRNRTSSFLTGKAVGTITYMSHDARQGAYSAASDVWALGCVMMYTVLRNCPDDILAAMKSEEFIRDARVVMSKDALFPAWLCDVILLKMLHHDPMRRPSANEVLSIIRKNASASPAVDAALRGKKTDDVYGSPSCTESFDTSTANDGFDNTSNAGGREHAESEEGVGGYLDLDDPQTILDDDDIAATSDHFELDSEAERFQQ